nr:hypothetical protein [Tanacetum cinerariifolium]
VEEGRGECSGGGGVDRSGGECLLLLVRCRERWKRVVGMEEMVEKRMAGKSGLNATVSAKLAGKMMLLLGLWGFDIVSPWVVKGLTKLVLKGLYVLEKYTNSPPSDIISKASWSSTWLESKKELEIKGQDQK